MFTDWCKEQDIELRFIHGLAAENGGQIEQYGIAAPLGGSIGTAVMTALPPR